jgi:hypothetical protein
MIRTRKHWIAAIFMALCLSLLSAGCAADTQGEAALDAGSSAGAPAIASDGAAGGSPDEEEPEYYDADSLGLAEMDEAEYQRYVKGLNATQGQASAQGQTAAVTAAGGADQSGGQDAAGGTGAQSTVRDQYQTDSVPDGMPQPQEPQNQTVTDKTLTCTLLIDCGIILNNMGKFDKNKESILPKDGVVFARRTVTFYEGESVFDLLLRETRNNGIHMEFVDTPIYNSAYIEGIANLYEFDTGNLSGWMYNVNGWYPNYGCSRYQLKDGDSVEWRYTCDLGRDLGVNWIG